MPKKDNNKKKQKKVERPKPLKDKGDVSHFRSKTGDLENWLSNGAFVILCYIMMDSSGTGSGSSSQANTLSIDDPNELLDALFAVLKHWMYAIQNRNELKVAIPIPLYNTMSMACCTEYTVNYSSHLIDYDLPSEWYETHRDYDAVLKQLFSEKGFFATRFSMMFYYGMDYLERGRRPKPMRVVYTTTAKFGSKGKDEREIGELVLNGNKPVLLNGKIYGGYGGNAIKNQMYRYYASIGPQYELEGTDVELVTGAFDQLIPKLCPIKSVEDRSTAAFTYIFQGGPDFIPAVKGAQTLSKDARAVMDAWVACLYAVCYTPEVSLPTIIPSMPAPQVFAVLYFAGCIMSDPAAFALHLDGVSVEYLRFVRFLFRNNYGDSTVPNNLSESIAMSRSSFLTDDLPGEKQAHIHARTYMVHETGLLEDDNILKEYAQVFDLFVSMLSKNRKNPSHTSFRTLAPNAATLSHLVQYARQTANNYCSAFSGSFRTSPLKSVDKIGLTPKMVVAKIHTGGNERNNKFEIDATESSFSAGGDSKGSYAIGSALPDSIKNIIRARTKDGATVDLNLTGTGGNLNTAAVTFPTFLMGVRKDDSENVVIDHDAMFEEISTILSRTDTTETCMTDYYTKLSTRRQLLPENFNRVLFFTRVCIAVGQGLQAKEITQKVVYLSGSLDTALIALGYQSVSTATHHLGQNIAMSCIASSTGVETDLWAKSNELLTKMGGWGALLSLLGPAVQTALGAVSVVAQGGSFTDVLGIAAHAFS